MFRSLLFMKPHKHAKKHQKVKKAIGVLVLLVLLAGFMFSWGLFLLNERLMPSAIAISQMHSKNKINEAINVALTQVVSQKKYNASDFLTIGSTQNPTNGQIAVNALLVNQICSQLAVDISKALSNGTKENIGVPVGVLLGIDSMANLGPTYSIKILPIGNTIVDYETTFVAAGINQIHFKIDLNVCATIRIMNPLQTQEVVVTRKIPLVDSVFPGQIPNVYFGNP